jgi:hypothetical protein
MTSPVVRRLPESERAWLRSTLRERWPHELLVGRGRVREISELSALVAVEGEERAGLLTYVIEGDVAELVTLDALRPGGGVGASLIERLAELARAAGGEEETLVTEHRPPVAAVLVAVPVLTTLLLALERGAGLPGSRHANRACADHLPTRRG